MAGEIIEEDKVDYVSELPDEIIREILYFLPVADAISVKLLSRRFRRIQVPLSNLYINQQTMFGSSDYKRKINTETFVEKVDSFLKSFNGSHLDAFAVEVYVIDTISPAMDNWIRFAISMEAESIDFDSLISFNGKLGIIPYKFPFHLLPKPKSFSRLKHLKLKNCLLDYCALTLNCLKTIELVCVELDQTSLDNLLSSCSELEWLTICACKMSEFLRLSRKLCVQSANLRGLRIVDWEFNCDIIEFNAPQLNTFEFDGKYIEDLVFHAVPSLERVRLLFHSTLRAEHFYSLLRQALPNLQTLSLRWYTDNNIPGTIPDFSSLKLLEFLPHRHKKFDFFSITHLLDVCPMLEKLHVEMLSFASTVTDLENEVVVLNSERAKYVKLEEITIGGFSGRDREMEFVKYLLNTTINLKRITLFYSRCKTYHCVWKKVQDRQILASMLEKKQFLHDTLRKEMASQDARLVIC